MGVLLPGVVFWGLLASASSAPADEPAGEKRLPSKFDEGFTLALGGFFPTVSSDFSINPSGGGQGGEINVEDDLGLDDSAASAWIAFNWRFQPRHQLQVEWFQLNRSGEDSAQRSFNPNDSVVVGLGASLSSKVDINLGRVTYGYSFFRREDWDGAILAGLHIATFKASYTASGNVTVNGTPLLAGSYSDSTSTHTVPLPHIGGSLQYRISPRWTASTTVLFFALEIDEYGGSLLEVDASASYQVSKHFGLGAGLKYFNLNLQANSGGGGGAEFDFTFFGPAVFGYARF